MKTAIFRSCIFLFISSLTLNAQAQKPTALLTKDREQDGFNGAVRRVKVETAKISVKEGKLVEGPRVVRAVTTYDIKGNRIDTVAHPVDVSLPSGKEQYRYDDKGNIVEMVLRGNDGAILSRESYQYEFDDVGNWKKMTASVATYEDGKLSFEPIEVTYRTFTYYYNQLIEKVIQSTPAKANATESVRSPTSPAGDTVAAKSISTNVSTPPFDLTKDAATSPESSVAETNKPAEVASAVSKTSETSAPARPPVKHVSEETLRAAAISLPAAEMPTVGQLKPMFRRVEVQVVIDEKGDVTSARGTAPEEMFNEAAEAAARKAKFAPGKLSDESSQIFGVINYEFSSGAASTPAATSELKPEVKIDTTAAKEPDPARAIEASASKTANSEPAVADPAADAYKQGVVQLNNKDYAQAEITLKQFVYRNPEDALGYTQLGFAYFGQQKYVEALAAFKMAIKIRPDLIDARTYYFLGVSYNALKKYPDALKAFKQGIYVLRAELAEAGSNPIPGAPSLYLFHYNLGISFQNLGSNRDAIKEFQQAVSLDPNAAEPHFGLALVYVTTGDRKSVLKEQETLKSLNPELAKKIGDVLASRTMFIPPGCLSFPCPNN